MNGNNYKSRTIAVKAFQYGVDPEPEWFNRLLKERVIMQLKDTIKPKIRSKCPLANYGHYCVVYKGGAILVAGYYLALHPTKGVLVCTEKELNELYEPAD